MTDPHPVLPPNVVELAIDASVNSVTIFGPDLRVRYANRVARSMILLPPGSPGPVGLPLDALPYPPDLLVRVRELLEEAFRGGVPLTGELVIPLPAGVVYSQYTLTPLHGAGGRVEAVLCVGTDVTELRTAERRLIEQEERYRRIVSEGRVFAWEHDHAADRTTLPAEYLPLVGLSPDSAPRTTAEWHAWFHPDDWPVVKAVVGECERTCGAGYEYPFRAVDVNGSERWFLVRARVERDATGSPVRSSGVLIDITERQRAELALAASEARFAAFMTNSPALAWVKDEHGRYEFINPAYAERFRLSADDTRGLTDADLFPPAVADLFRQNDRRVRDSQTALTATEYTEDADGRRRPWLVAKFPLPGGRVGGFSIDMGEVARLEEEQRKVERQMLQAQKLESLGVLAGGIAHDFNNLLTAVLGFASLARLDPALSAETKGHLAQIESAAQRAAELCRQMLAYAGRGQFLIGRVDVNAIISEMTQLLTTAISKRAVLKFNLAADLPGVRADATQIRQVVMNLITNASDAIAERSGVITLSTGSVDADQTYLTDIGATHLRPARYVYLEVSDTGGGMSDDVKGRIFEPFFTTKFTGRGLGLAAVQGIVRAHGGAIKIYTQIDKGTTFKVLLPADESAADAHPPQPAVAPLIGRGRCVLVVDDEEDVRVLTRKTLLRAGFQVEVAADGRAGVEVFQADPDKFAVVILDLTMPKMGGAEAFRRMRLARPDVKVILASGYAAEDATTGFEGKGLAAFVRKPFRVEELLAAVADALGEGQDSAAKSAQKPG